MPGIPSPLVDEEPSLWNKPLSSPLFNLTLPKSDRSLPGSELQMRNLLSSHRIPDPRLRHPQKLGGLFGVDQWFHSWT